MVYNDSNKYAEVFDLVPVIKRLNLIQSLLELLCSSVLLKCELWFLFAG